MLTRYLRDLKLSTFKEYLEGGRQFAEEDYLTQPEENLVASLLRAKKSKCSLDVVIADWNLPRLGVAIQTYLHSQRYGASARISHRRPLPALSRSLKLKIFQRLEIPVSSRMGKLLDLTDVVRCALDWKGEGARNDCVLYHRSHDRMGVAKIRLIFEATLSEKKELFVVLEPMNCRFDQHGMISCQSEDELIVGLVDTITRACHLIKMRENVWMMNEFVDCEMMFHSFPLLRSCL